MQNLSKLKCPTCEEMRYIKNKGCTDIICVEYNIIKDLNYKKGKINGTSK